MTFPAWRTKNRRRLYSVRLSFTSRLLTVTRRAARSTSRFPVWNTAASSGFVVLNRENNHRRVTPLAEAAQDLLSREVGQTHIEDNDRRAMLGGENKPLLSAGGGENAVSIFFQGDGEQAANLWFVIDDQYKHFVRRTHSFSCGTGGILVRGSRTVKIAPMPSRFAAVAAPPWASANPLTSDRPIPVPPGAAFEPL